MHLIQPKSRIAIYRSFDANSKRPHELCGFAYATTTDAGTADYAQIQHWYLRADAPRPPHGSYYLEWKKFASRNNVLKHARALAKAISGEREGVLHHVGITQVFDKTDVPEVLKPKFFRDEPVPVPEDCGGENFSQVDPGTIGVGDWQVRGTVPQPLVSKDYTSYLNGLSGLVHRHCEDEITEEDIVGGDELKAAVFGPALQMMASAWSEFFVLRKDRMQSGHLERHAYHEHRLEAIPDVLKTPSGKVLAIQATGLALPTIY